MFDAHRLDCLTGASCRFSKFNLNGLHNASGSADAGAIVAVRFACAAFFGLIIGLAVAGFVLLVLVASAVVYWRVRRARSYTAIK